SSRNCRFSRRSTVFYGEPHRRIVVVRGPGIVGRVVASAKGAARSAEEDGPRWIVTVAFGVAPLRVGSGASSVLRPFANSTSSLRCAAASIRCSSISVGGAVADRVLEEERAAS
ncbi:MAG: hypothetical protein KDC95_20865, partial [Planctomycetes bacterium]|nr:hypothetical protein [Planctomycetota bacterium]